jgi:hypothetical protein
MSVYRYQGLWINPQGYAMAGGLVYVCGQPNSISPTDPTIPPSPLANLFTDSTGSVPAANPVQVDGNGNFFFYAAPNVYTLVFFDPVGRMLTPVVFPDIEVVSPGGGTVSSVALTVPSELSVSGSPITGSGTLAISKSNVNANLVAAGPGSGSAAQWSFRALVAADLPGGIGTVSSVAVTISGSGLLSLGSSGGPVTTAGTIALTVNFNNQNANTFLAGPTSGGAGAISARAIVAADLPSPAASVLIAETFSATPTFDASTGCVFTMTLTANVTSSTVSNPTAGQRIVLILTQDGTGSRTFAFPANFKGATAVDSAANSVSVQEFVYDSVNWRAIATGSQTSS